MAKVVIENISKIYPGGIKAVDNASLTIEDREFVVLVGPSGCGKSTTLRMIAGLEEISSGNVYIDGKRMNDVPPKDRDIAMVFQNYALYPHMSVYKNMAFGLKLRKYPKAEIEKRVREAAEILGITDDQLQRKPKTLSGGQRQRVAVGRAIVRKPKAFLFDEPLSNLDAKMRVQMRAEISKLHSQLQSTMIYVTHDQVEAMTMGDRIVVMKDGLIQQVAKPIDLYDQPVNMFVAGFIGTADFIPAQVNRGRLISEIGSVPWEPVEPHRDFTNGTGSPADLEVMVRPDCLDCHLSDEGQGIISGREFRGAFYLYKVELPSGHSVRCLLSHTREYPVGSPVSVTLRDGHTLKPFVGGRSIDG